MAWTAAGPGSGFFPLVLAVGMGFNAALILTRSLRPESSPGGPFIPPGAHRPLLIVFLPMVAVVALINLLGMYLGGAVYLAGYMWLVGRHRWPAVLLVSILLPLTLFLLFERWFLLPLPKGAILEFLLYGK